jgi:hypothetical protein
VLDEEVPALVLDERVLQAHLAALDLAQDLLELGDRFLEVLRRGGVLLHGHRTHLTGGTPADEVGERSAEVGDATFIRR